MSRGKWSIVLGLALLGLSLGGGTVSQGAQNAAVPTPSSCQEGADSTTAVPAWEDTGVEHRTSVDLGEPGLSFRYVETFGETGQPYIVDPDHLNGVNGISLDGADNLWIAEWHGHRALKYDSTGAFRMSIGDPGRGGMLGGLGDVTVGSDGTVWVADAERHRVVQFSASGDYIDHLGVEWETGSDNDHFDNPLGVAFDSSGRLYVSDLGNHRVQIFDGSGTYQSTLGVTGEADSDNAHFDHPDSLFIDDDDNLYVADSGNHRIQIFDNSGGYSATLGVSGESGWDNDHLDSPSDVSVDDDGNIYVADTNNHRVQIFDSSLDYIARLGETGIMGSDDDHFQQPEGVVVDSSGTIYVSDWGNFRVQVFDSDLHHARTLGTTGVPYRTDEDHFNYPADVAADDAGHLFVVEANGHRLLKLDSSGGLEAAVGTAGIAGSGHHLLSAPSGVSLDSDGRVYVADRDNHRVQIFDRDLQYVDTMGTSSCDTGNNALCSPHDVAVDATGNVYIADTGNERVQVFDSSYDYVATLGVTGLAGSDDDHFRRPRGVAVDRRGNVYVADEENTRVQTCTVTGSTGNCSTFAGETGVFGDDFGHLRAPLDVAVDDESRVYVCDSYWNQRIQVFDERGAYLTTVGGEWGGYNGEFRNPEGIDVDRRGSLYVADTENTRVQHYTAGVSGWKQVNINGFGDADNQGAWALKAYDDALYVSTFNFDTGAEVHRWSSGSWQRVVSGGFGDRTNVGVDWFAEFEGRLYASTWNDNGNGSKGGQIWRSPSGDSGSWEWVVDNGFGDSTNGEIMVLAPFEGYLYAGTWSYDTGVHGAEIWRSATGNEGSWTRVASDGFNDDSDNVAILSIEVFNGHLYASTYKYSAGGEIWHTDNGVDWAQVNDDGFGNADNIRVVSLEVYKDALYAGTWNWEDGGEIWRTMNGTSWEQVMSGGFVNVDNSDIASLVAFDGDLYAIVGNFATGPEVWRSPTGDSGSWERVADAGFGCAGALAVDWDNAAAVFDGDLYIGTFTWGSGGGRVWRKESYAVYLPLTTKNWFNSPYEPHNSPTDAYGPLRADVVYQAYPDDPEDWYFFNLPGARDVTVEVSDFTGRDGRLMVYAAEDTDSTVPDGDDSSGGSTMIVTPSDLPSGKYYIRVYTGGSTNVTTLYNLIVSY